MMFRLNVCMASCCVALLCWLSSPVTAEDLPITGTIQVTPSSLTLKHHRHEQSLIVSGRTAEGKSLRTSAKVEAGGMVDLDLDRPK